MSAEVAVARRSLYPVTDADKRRRVVSRVRQDDGTELVVSRYGDAVWDFWPSIPAGNIVPSEKRLNWALSLPDGHTLLDPEHSVLLASAKDFIYSLAVRPGRRASSAEGADRHQEIPQGADAAAALDGAKRLPSLR